MEIVECAEYELACLVRLELSEVRAGVAQWPGARPLMCAELQVAVELD